MPTRPHVDVLYHPEEADQVRDLIAELEANGLDVQRADQHPADGDALAVFITPAMLQPDAAEYATKLAAGYQEVIPVSFLPGAAPLFADLSQSLVAQLGTGECARRIATITRHGGRAIVAWNNLLSRAQKWESEGAGALLPEAEIPAALAQLQSGPALESARRPLVVDYVTASQQAVRRRRRTGMTVVGAVAAILAVVLAFAVVQAVSARSAQLEAERTGGIADSNRLARAALEVAAGDPDLPLVLADRALSAARTPAAETAAAQAMAETWPHTSHRLDFRPFTVTAAADSPRIAVFDDASESIVVFESAGGRSLRSFPVSVADGYVGYGWLNPSGRLLATGSSRGSSIQVFDVGSGDALHAATDWNRPKDAPYGWLDEDKLLVARGNTLLSVDPRSGSSSTVAEVPRYAPINAAALSHNRKHVVATTETTVTAVDLDNGNASKTIRAKVGGPQITDDGKYVLGTDYPYTVRVSLDAGERDEDPVQQIAGTASTVIPLADNYDVVAGRDGDMHLVTGSTILQSVRAHLSDAVRIARLNDGRLVTTGADGYLRVWTLPDAATLGVSTSVGPSLSDHTGAGTLGIKVGPRESARNQIRLPSDGHLAVTITPGRARVLSTSDLSSTDRWFFAGIDTDLTMSRRTATIVSVGRTNVRSFQFSDADQFWNDDGTQRIVGKHLSMALGEAGTGVAAISENGKTAVFADDITVQTRTAEVSRQTDSSFPAARRPVALYADDDGAAVVLTADGYLRRSNGSEAPLPWPPGTSKQIEVAAGEFASLEELTLVTPAGTLYTLNNGTMSEIGNVGAGLMPFAVRRSIGNKLIGVVGDRGLTVLDTGSKRVVHQEPSHGKVLVTDVAFSSNEQTLFVVTEIGTVRKTELTGKPDPGPQPPRALTSDELSLFNLDGS